MVSITTDSIITSKKIAPPQFSKARLLGEIDYAKDSLFVLVDKPYTSRPVYLNIECYESFKTMYAEAVKDGITLKILSGARNFNYQKGIWERKWRLYKNLESKERVQKILEYSAMPATSRHHWGTDIDINALSDSYFTSGKGKAEYQWLKENAHKFGFYQVYTSKDEGRTGYNEEKWHWSYLPIASKYLKDYNETILISDIKGFEGADIAEGLDIITKYVNGISQKALNFKD